MQVNIIIFFKKSVFLCFFLDFGCSTFHAANLTLNYANGILLFSLSRSKNYAN